MADALYVGIAVAFFTLTWGLVSFAERPQASDKEDRKS